MTLLRGGSRAALTLVELLATIAIIGLLVGLLIPSVQSAREAARRAACANNIRQIALALNHYHSSQGHLPPTFAGFAYNTCDARFPEFASTLKQQSGASRDSVYSFVVGILPYLDAQTLFDRFDRTQAWTSATNRPLVQTVVPSLICPSDPDAASPILPRRSNDSSITAHGLWYAGSAGPAAPYGGNHYCPSGSGQWCFTYTTATLTCPNGSSSGWYYMLDSLNKYAMFGQRWMATRFDDVQDGLTNTILLAETKPRDDVTNAAYNVGGRTIPVVSLVAPINAAPVSPNASPFLNAAGTWTDWWQAQVKGPRSAHPQGCHMAMCDGAVVFFADITSIQVLCRLGHRKDGQVTSVP